jgi:predicted Zn-dependent peptidase
MSSRLFQQVREKSALAYSVYSFLSSFSDTGIFAIYAACDPTRVPELLTILKKETSGLPTVFTEENVLTAKNQMKGNIVMAMESSDARMNRLARGEYYFGRYLSIEEIIDTLEAVTRDEIVSLAEQTLSPGPFSMVALGPLDESKDIFRQFQE